MYFCFKKAAHTIRQTMTHHLPLGVSEREGRLSSGKHFSQKAFARLLPISATDTIHSDFSTFAEMLCTSLIVSYTSFPQFFNTPNWR